jgi:hypothetical protein
VAASAAPAIASLLFKRAFRSPDCIQHADRLFDDEALPAHTDQVVHVAVHREIGQAKALADLRGVPDLTMHGREHAEREFV